MAVALQTGSYLQGGPNASDSAAESGLISKQGVDMKSELNAIDELFRVLGN